MNKSVDVAIGFFLVGLVAILDIAVIALILNPLVSTLTSAQYNNAVNIWHIALAAFVVLVALLFWLGLGKPFTALWFVGLTAGGWEDAFYFWLQGQQVPAALPWLPHYPTATILYTAMAASVVILYVITREWK